MPDHAPPPTAEEAPTPPPRLSGWGRLRSRAWVRWTMDLTLAVLVVQAVLLWQTRHLIASDEPAPPLQLTTTGGQPLDLEALRGRNVLIAFWAPWCGVCKVESSTLSALRRDLGQDTEVISVVVGYSDPRQVEAFMAEHGVDYPVLLGDDATARAWHVDRFPTLYIINPEGRIASSTVGYSTSWGIRARLLLYGG